MISRFQKSVLLGLFLSSVFAVHAAKIMPVQSFILNTKANINNTGMECSSRNGPVESAVMHSTYSNGETSIGGVYFLGQTSNKTLNLTITFPECLGGNTESDGDISLGIKLNGAGLCLASVEDHADMIPNSATTPSGFLASFIPLTYESVQGEHPIVMRAC